MPVVGFNFEKILVERTKPITSQLNIKQDVSIVDLVEEKLPGNKESIARFNFEFKVDYQEKDESKGQVLIRGHVLFLEDPKVIKDIMDTWKKEGKVLPQISTTVLNSILFKCNIKALGLSNEINLPPHIPIIPKMKLKKKSK